MSVRAFALVVMALFSCRSSYVQEDAAVNAPMQKDGMMDENTKMGYIEAGNNKGPILILLHGLASNAKAYQKLIPELEDTYHIYALDFPKYLDTDDNSDVGMKSYAHMVKEFMEEHQIEQAIVGGHSMGGQVALHLAYQYPERVSHLVLLAPAGIERFDNEKDRAWFKTYIKPEIYLMLNDAMIKRNFDVNFYGGELPADAQFMYDDRLKIKEDSMTYGRYIDYIVKCIFSMLDQPVTAMLPQIDIPTIIMYGDSDLLIPNKILHPTLEMEDLRTEAHKLPRHEFTIVDRAGHFVQWDNPKDVASRLQLFTNQ